MGGKALKNPRLSQTGRKPNKKTAMKVRLLSRPLAGLLALLATPMAALALPNITALVQTGGDDNANTPGVFTGQTYTHPNLASQTVPFFSAPKTLAFRDR